MGRDVPKAKPETPGPPARKTWRKQKPPAFVEARIRHYQWLASRGFELFSIHHEVIDAALKHAGIAVPA